MLEKKNMNDNGNLSVGNIKIKNSTTIKNKRPISIGEKFSHEVMPKVYGFGAAISILGAMFKLLSLPGGAFMLGAGLSAEAFIFFISAFEKPAKSFDWSIVFPQLDEDFAFEHGITNEKGVVNYDILTMPFANGNTGNGKNITNGSLNDLLEKCNVDKETLNNLGAGIKNLSTLCANLGTFSKININFDSLSESINNTNISLNKIAVLGKNISSSFEKIDNCFGRFTEPSGLIHKVESGSVNFSDGLTSLNSKITALNNSYEGVIKALKG